MRKGSEKKRLNGGSWWENAMESKREGTQRLKRKLFGKFNFSTRKHQTIERERQKGHRGGTVSAKVGSRFLKTSTSHISDHKSYSRKSIAMVCYAFRITKDSRRTEKAKIKIFKKFSSASFHFLLASLRSGSEHKVPCSDNQFNSLKNLFRKFLCVCGYGFFEKQQAPWGVV